MQLLRVAAATALTAGLATAALAQGGNLVRNGDFEAGGPVPSWLSVHAGSAAVAGWRVTSGYVDLVGRWWQPAGGGGSLEVGSPGPGAVEQSVATVAGRHYRLSFALSGNPEGPPRVKTLIVTAGPVSRTFTFDTTGRTRQNMGWRTVSLDFTATSSATTIGFARTDGSPRSGWWGPAIDDVSVTPLDAGAAPAAGSASAPSAAPVAMTTPRTTASAAPRAPAARPLAASTAPAALASPAPARTMAPRPAAASAGFAPSGSDPYSGLWGAAYPGRPLRVYLERHGDQVSARIVDGEGVMPTGRLAWSGRVNRSPLVVLGACADAEAKGWHGAVIEWLRQDAFRLRVADCHAGEVVYTRWH